MLSVQDFLISTNGSPCIGNNQLSKERKMPLNANQMFHLAKSKEEEYRNKWIESIEADIRSNSSQGLFRTSQCFGRASSFYVAALKEHFTKIGFDVTEEKDEDGDPRLVFSWENAKDDQPSA